jgi:hypothetical protein
MGNSGKLAYHRFKLSHSDRGQRQNHMKKNHKKIVRRSIGVCAVTVGALLFSQPVLTWAQTPSPTTKEASKNGASLRDGRHDFDFALGS